MRKKYVYFFGDGQEDGNESMKNLLGGKGANLAEMAGNKDLRLPVPPGFTITTEVCTYYYQHKRSYPEGLREQAEKAVKRIEAGMALAIRKAKPCLAGRQALPCRLIAKKFCGQDNPPLVSMRSGARRSRSEEH